MNGNILSDTLSRGKLQGKLNLNSFIKTCMLCLLLAIAQLSVAGEQADVDSQFCYLPTLSNVAYSTIAKLPVASPSEVIAYGRDRFQFAELWLPPVANFDNTQVQREPLRRAPLVVLVHGGCWLNSFDITHTHALSTALSQSGYAVWSIEYRRTGDPGGGWPGSYNDVKSAIAYMPELAQFPVDLENVAIVGHSAGGHLALLAGADHLYGFKAVVGLAAIVDLAKYAQGENSCQTATPKFMSGTIDSVPEAYLAANPAERVLHKTTVLLHGKQDSIVPIEHAKSSNMRVRLIDGGGHFDVLHPGTQSFRTLLQELARAFAK
ncbi:MAG: alpha/beta fold hydrolase [Arenicella sp.]|nr:alpha/beta fold hydrolase [Arenicella sp.]